MAKSVPTVSSQPLRASKLDMSTFCVAGDFFLRLKVSLSGPKWRVFLHKGLAYSYVYQQRFFQYINREMTQWGQK